MVGIDVLIVGAGLSGLVTAHRLLQKDATLKILIVECSEHIGGQIQSNFADEMGAMWINKNQKHFVNLCEELGIKLVKRNIDNTAKNPFRFIKGVLAFAVRFEIQQFLHKFDLISKAYDPTEKPKTYKPVSMERYICGNLLFPGSRNLIRMLVRAVSGVDPQDISFTEYMTLCHGTHGITNQFQCLTGSGDLYTVSPNIEEVTRTLMDEINSGMCIINTLVTEICQFEKSVHVYTDKGDHIEALLVVLAIPWQAVQQITFLPNIPREHRIKTINSKRFVTNFKAKYNHIIWNDRNDFDILHQPDMVYYATDSMTLSGLIFHNEENSEQIQKEYILMRIMKNFDKNIKKPIEWRQKTWLQSQFLNLPPILPWNRIIWSSTNSATQYRGYLSGAVQSGYRAALLSLQILRPQTVHWQDLRDVQSAHVVKEQVGYFDLFCTSLSIYNICFYSTSSVIIGTSLYLIKHFLNGGKFKINF